MKRITSLLIVLSMAGSAVGQRKEKDGGYDTTGFTNRMSYIAPTGESSLIGSSALDISDEMDVKLRLTYGPKSKKWLIAMEDNLGTTDDFTPILNADKWAVDNTLGAKFSLRVGSNRWAFEDTLSKAIDKVKEIWQSRGQSLITPIDISNLRTVAFDSLASRKNLSQSSEHWLNFGIKWGTQEYLTLHDSLYVGMREVFKSTRVNGLLISLSYNASRIFSYKSGFQLAGSLGFTINTGGTNYKKLKKTEVYTGMFTVKDTSGFIATSSPVEKGRKGNLITSCNYIFNGDVHFIIRPRKVITLDLFGSFEWTLGHAELNYLEVKTGLNFGVPNSKDQTVANIGIGLIFKDVFEKYVSVSDRQDRLVPVFMVGVPIPEIH